MNTNYTDITMLLDRSGSMQDIKKATLTGINEFLQTQRTASAQLAQEGRRIQLSLDEESPVICKFTLIQFASGVFIKTIDAMDINQVQDLTDSDYHPNGGTPLIRSWCRAIDETGQRLAAMPEAERPGRVIFTTATDGQETEHDIPKSVLTQKINTQTNEFNWQFMYIGANQDAIIEAQSFGVAANNAMSYAASSVGTQQAWNSMSNNITRKRSVDANVMSHTGYEIGDYEVQLRCLAADPAAPEAIAASMTMRALVDNLKNEKSKTPTAKP